MTNKKSTQNSNNLINHKKNLIIIVSVFIIVLLVVLNFITGFVGYSFNYMKCGHSPVVANTGSDYHYYLPDQPGYAPNYYSVYYCSAQDAQSAGQTPAL